MKRFYEWFFPKYLRLWPTSYVLAMWRAPDRKLGETDWQALRITLRKNPHHARLVHVFKAGIVCLMAMVMLTGCATTQLPATATDAEKKAAMCQDALVGQAIVAIAVGEPQTEAGKVYWEKYNAAVELAIKTYCM